MMTRVSDPPMKVRRSDGVALILGSEIADSGMTTLHDGVHDTIASI
jgi:hypothetical protein